MTPNRDAGHRIAFNAPTLVRKPRRLSARWRPIAAGVVVLAATSPGIADTLLGGWTFDSTPAAPNTPTVNAANVGFYGSSANVYLDGSNGASTWVTATSGDELTSSVGDTLGDPRSSSIAGNALAILNSTANSKKLVIKVPTTSYQDITLKFATRGSATGFSIHQWAWSANGTDFTNFGVNTAPTGTTSFAIKTLALSGTPGVDDAAFVYFRLTVSGASSTGYNRLDNVLVYSANYTWFGATSTVYNSGANWTAPGLTMAAAPTSTSATNLNFQGAPSYMPTISSATTIKSVLFDTGASPVTVGGAGTLTMYGGLTNRSSNSQAVNTPIKLAASQTWRATNGDLVIGGDVNDYGKTLTLTGPNTITINGAIGGGAGSLVVNGNAVFTGPNSYTGTTTINGGMLCLDGTHTGGGGYAVGDGTNAATLAGAGSTTSTVTVANAATIAPSVSANGMSVGALTLNPGGATKVQLDSVSSFSFIKVTAGAASLGGDLQILLNSYVPALGAVFKIIDNTTANANSGAFANLANSYLKDTTSTYWFSVFTGGSDNNDVFIQRQAVPEPSAAILGLLGAAMLRRRTRR